MFHKITLQDLDNYFLPRSKRVASGIYFNRFLGFDDKSMNFLSHFYAQTKKNGIYIKTPLVNPNEHQVQYFYEMVGREFQCSKDGIGTALISWLPRLLAPQREVIKEALFTQLEQIRSEGKNENIVKNAYIKFMCWFYYRFESILHQLNMEEVPKILHEGMISKYELYMLHILALSGCDVLLVDFVDDVPYLQVDPRSVYADLKAFPQRGKPPVHFSKMDWEQKHQSDQMESQLHEFSQLVETNSWMIGEFFDEVFKVKAQRGPLPNKFYNLFIEYTGVDNPQEYENSLFFWKLKLDSAKKKYIILENKIENPSMEEVQKVKKSQWQSARDLIYQLSKQIILADQTLKYLTQKAFIDVMETEDTSNLGRLTNRGICLVCWLSRYAKILLNESPVNEVPLFIYMGGCNQNEALFFRLLSRLPVDVIIINPDAAAVYELNCPESFKKKGDQSLAIKEFPKQERKVQVSTVAYEAERDLDTLLYQDTGLFRERQFLKSVPVTLRTTYEEIDILWKEDAKFRPSFQALNDRVMVPSVFAKISGVKNGDVNAYWQTIESEITEDTILIQNIPNRQGTDANPVKPHVSAFYKNNQLLVDKIKSHHSYQYDYLRENVQDYILDKIQGLLESDYIKCDSLGVEYTIISTLLNLDQMTIRMIQKFDFTKAIPKLIIISTKEDMCSLEDSIYIAFLSLVGFDILIYSPTGYRTEGKHLKADLFIEHQIGDYVFDLNVPSYRLTPGKSAGKNVFTKLFGRGRN